MQTKTINNLQISFSHIIRKFTHHWYEGYNHPNDKCSISNYNGNEAQNRVVKAEDTLCMFFDVLLEWFIDGQGGRLCFQRIVNLLDFWKFKRFIKKLKVMLISRVHITSCQVRTTRVHE